MNVNDMQNFVDEDVVDFEKLVLKYYYHINLDEIDAIILIKLNALKSMGVNIISPMKLKKITSLSVDDCSKRLDKLISLGYITISIVINDKGRETETFDFHNLFEKIFMYMFDKKTKIIEQEAKNDISTVIKMFESELNKSLSPMELEICNRWIGEDRYTVELIKEALLESVKIGKVSIQYVDGILLRMASRANYA